MPVVTRTERDAALLIDGTDLVWTKDRAGVGIVPVCTAFRSDAGIVSTGATRGVLDAAEAVAAMAGAAVAASRAAGVEAAIDSAFDAVIVDDSVGTD